MSSSVVAIDEEAAQTVERKSASWQIRPMRREDIEQCLTIWLQVELTEAYQTVASTLKTDPNGFYVAELNTTGEIIGMCSGTLTRDDTAFMGFYAVEPSYQGIGVGRELWATTIGRLDESINVGLYGVPTMSEKYKKSGFKVEDTSRMLIFESQPGGSLKLECLKNLKNNQTINDNGQLLSMCEINSQTNEVFLNNLIEFDRSVNGFSREKLLRNYLAGDDPPLTLALVQSGSLETPSRLTNCCSTAGLAQDPNEDDENKLSNLIESSLGLEFNRQDGNSSGHFKDNTNDAAAEIVGYGCIRHDNTDGGMIGPIYANSSEHCEIILKNLLEKFQLGSQGKYSAMSLTSNKLAGDILTKIGLAEIDQCSRMFTKFAPVANVDKIFYVHSPNFTLF